MKTPLTPNDIEVLLWCHIRGTRHERHDAPAVRDALRMFERSGMIAPQPGLDGVYNTTAKGRAMVTALCRTPEPIEKSVWLDARTVKPL